jgi:hypothetical protein
MSLPDAVVLFAASGLIGRDVVAARRDRTELVSVTRGGRTAPGFAIGC